MLSQHACMPVGVPALSQHSLYAIQWTPLPRLQWCGRQSFPCETEPGGDGSLQPLSICLAAGVMQLCLDLGCSCPPWAFERVMMADLLVAKLSLTVVLSSSIQELVDYISC